MSPYIRAVVDMPGLVDLMALKLSNYDIGKARNVERGHPTESISVRQTICSSELQWLSCVVQIAVFRLSHVGLLGWMIELVDTAVVSGYW